jgi:hypothetical protein
MDQIVQRLRDEATERGTRLEDTTQDNTKRALLPQDCSRREASIKNVQNVKSVVKRLLSAGSDSSLNSSLKPILHQGEESSVKTSQSVPLPAAHPSYREGAPAAAGTPEASVNNEERSSFSEDSQEEDERESMGISSSEEVKNAQGNRNFSEERRPSRDSQREVRGNNAGGSRMMGQDIRDARDAMRIVKDTQDEGHMLGGTAMQGLMDQELALQATPIVKKVILNPKTSLFYDYACTNLNFKGDVGDFIQDAIEDFWKSRGYRIVIEKRSEIEIR